MDDTNFSPGRFAALLFDMDGTVLSSLASAERIWAEWAREHDIDVEKFLPTIHGVQAVETIRRQALPGVDPKVEAARITRAEIDNEQKRLPVQQRCSEICQLIAGLSSPRHHGHWQNDAWPRPACRYLQ